MFIIIGQSKSRVTDDEALQRALRLKPSKTTNISLINHHLKLLLGCFNDDIFGFNDPCMYVCMWRKELRNFFC